MAISHEALETVIKELGSRKIGNGISVIPDFPEENAGAFLSMANPYGTESVHISKNGVVINKDFTPSQDPLQ